MRSTYATFVVIVILLSAARDATSQTCTSCPPLSVDLSDTDVTTALAPVDMACLDSCLGAVTCNDPSQFGSIPCNSAIKRYCADQGFVGGFGPVRDAGSGNYEVVCLSANAASYQDNVPFSALVAVDPACATIADAQAGLCNPAFDAYCKSLGVGFQSGFGAVEHATTNVDFVCVKGTVADERVVSIASLGGGCSYAGALTSASCDLAIGQHCRDDGHASGFGAVDRDDNGTPGIASDDTLTRVCVATHAPEQEPRPQPTQEILLGRATVTNSAGSVAVGALRSSHFRTNRAATFDGRVALWTGQVQSGPQAGTSCGDGAGHVCVHLADPERFSTPFLGTIQTLEPPSYAIPANLLHQNASQGQYVSSSAAICDPARGELVGNQDVAGRARNPRGCTHGGAPADCYDVTIVGIFRTGTSGSYVDELWGVDATIAVGNPKTASAAVVDVTVKTGTHKKSAFTLAQGDDEGFLEPAVSGDGRVLMIHNRGAGLQYSVIAPDEGAPCDVSKWAASRGDFDSVAAMYLDADMAAYGMARYPLRDTEGNLIGAGQGVRGAYPWIDRNAENFAFTQARGVLYYHEPAVPVALRKYPMPASDVLPVGATIAELDDAISSVSGDGVLRLGLTIAGAWTHGKFVTLDSRLNPADFGLKSDQGKWLKLYTLTPPGPGPEGSMGVRATSMTVIQSPGSVWNFLPNMRPNLPQEVVWLVSTDDQTAEQGFDDWINPHALIVSSMNASIDNPGRMFNDGFGAIDDPGRGTGWVLTPRVANSATAVSDAVEAAVDHGSATASWEIPNYGKLLGGARIEPVAAGGVLGKGLYLDGGDRLEYDVPAQSPSGASAMASATWVTWIALDPRDGTSSAPRRLLSYPDGSWVDLVGNGLIRLGRPGQTSDVTIGSSALQLADGRWGFLGFVSEPTRTTVYVNGLRYGAPVTGSFLRPQAGRITVGQLPSSSRSGFKGWIDDFKVIAGAPTIEAMCNHAYGTVTGVQSGDAYYGEGNAYPTSTHSEIRSIATATSFTRFACERPLSGTAVKCIDKLRRDHDPNACIRDQLLDRPVLHSELPRSNEQANAFCRSCHDEGSAWEPLQVATALAAGTQPLRKDPRRQPMDPPPHVFGIIPTASYFDHVEAGSDGWLVDCYMLGRGDSVAGCARECADTIDNDGDGVVDGADAYKCTSVSDVSEAYDCQDGIDNDGDGKVDAPADPSCSGPTDQKETSCGLLGIEPLIAIGLARLVVRRRRRVS